MENLSLSYLSVRAPHESVPVSSNSICSQESVAHVVLNVHPQKSCTRQNFPCSLALLFSLFTLSFSLRFHLSNLTCYDFTQPESWSSSLFNFHCLWSPSSSSCSPYKTYTWHISSELKDLSDMCIRCMLLKIQKHLYDMHRALVTSILPIKKQ